MGVVIPYPELTRRYVKLAKANSTARLREAESATVREYAGLICDSVREFEGFDVSPKEPFYPSNAARDLNKSPEAQQRTFGWAMAIKNTQPAISTDGDEALDFRYVAREVAPAHTKPRGRFAAEDGHFISTDLILDNPRTRRPIVAELKVGRDKDPFTALVQALAAAAQLAPSRQRARLRRLSADLATYEEDPLLDVYVLLARFPPRNRHRWFQLAYARGLAAGLEAHPHVREHLGRIALLTVHRSTEDHVSASSVLPVPGTVG